jgi:DNA-binding CsgD family transcriptional regulator
VHGDDRHVQVISEIYDAAMRPSRWEQVLDRMGEVGGAGGLGLFVADPTTEEFALSAASSVFSPERMLEYVERYQKSDAPAYEALSRFPALRLISDDEALARARDASALPARVWLRETFGLRSRAASRLHDEGVWFDVLVTQFSADAAELTSERLRPLNHLLPHVAKTLELSRTFAVLRHRFHAVLAALDRFHVGVMVVSPSLAVVVKNREAERILALADGIALDARDRPRATAEAARGVLRVALEEAIATSSGQANGAALELTLPRRSGATGFLVEICPFVDGGGEFETAFRGAYVLVIDPDDTRHVRTEGMQVLYALTDAESAVCSLLAQGLSTTDMADARGVSPETLRTQVKSLLQKTRSRNRAELVRRALLVNLPIDDAP